MAVERVGVSFEPGLLERFDELIRNKGYTNRSEAIRDLVRESIIKSDVSHGDSRVIGTLTLIYDHDEGDVTNRLLHVQHHHHADILSTTPIHINERACLEVLVVRGKSKDVKKLSDNLRAIKGVKHGELVITRATFRGG